MPAGRDTFGSGEVVAGPGREGGAALRTRRGAMREKLAREGDSAVEGEKHPGRALLFPRRGEEMALPALQHRRVCAGLEGREGRG